MLEVESFDEESEDEGEPKFDLEKQKSRLTTPMPIEATWKATDLESDVSLLSSDKFEILGESKS